jgi:hypothetical protein
MATKTRISWNEHLIKQIVQLSNEGHKPKAIEEKIGIEAHKIRSKLADLRKTRPAIIYGYLIMI